MLLLSKFFHYARYALFTVYHFSFVDKETTFQEVLNILELPEDAQTEDFEGFKLAHINDYHNENTPVDELASIYVTASYISLMTAIESISQVLTPSTMST